MTDQRYAYDTETNVKIVAIWCPGCGVPYGLAKSYRDARREDHKSWRCPNGCSLSFPRGTSEAERLREQLDAARSLAARESDRRILAERQQAAAAGELVRIRKRIGNGVCPCCNRTFKNLGNHMAGQHPDYALAEPDGFADLTLADLTPNQVEHIKDIGRAVDRGEGGVDLYWLHTGTIRALERRGLVSIDEDEFVRPTKAGLGLVEAAGGAS